MKKKYDMCTKNKTSKLKERKKKWKKDAMRDECQKRECMSCNDQFNVSCSHKIQTLWDRIHIVELKLSDEEMLF